MFDNYIFTADSCQNIIKDGKIAGFEIKTLIPYYRGIPLSMVHDIQVEVDGKPIDQKQIRFSPNDGRDWFTLSEMETVAMIKWEYGQTGTVYIQQDGGLSPGKHQVSLTVVIRVAYIPVPFSGTRTRTVEIASK